MYLSENEIKLAALKFLRTYYKYRPRVGETSTGLDNENEEGIIADGIITFPTDLTEKFFASFEATSYATAHEVKYKPKKARLRWDAISVCSLACTIIFCILYVWGGIKVDSETWHIAAIAWVLGSCVLTGAYLLALRNLPFYREIYAIEQFKMYKADEQWIAVGEDVFENPEDKYMEELKRQCTLSGFGLLMVDKDHDVRQVITPATIPVEGKKRKEKEFAAAAPSGQGGVGNIAAWQRMARFRYDFTVQLLLLLFSGSVIAAILWQEAVDKPTVEADTSEYRKKMLDKRTELMPETQRFVVDTGALVSFDGEITDYDLDELTFYDQTEVDRWYNKFHRDSLYDALTDETNPDRQRILDSLKLVLAELRGKPPEKPTIGNKPKPRKPKRTGIDPWCKEYAPWSGSRHILQDGVYTNRKLAEARVEQINLASAAGGILKGGCFKESKPYYIVYVDHIYTEKGRASAALPYFNQLLKDKGYSSGELELKSLTVKR